ncbi:gamma-glutamyltransferase [Acidobacteriota bacterium]
MRFFKLLVATCLLTMLASNIDSLSLEKDNLIQKEQDAQKYVFLNQGPKAPAVGNNVMVSTQLPIATEGALNVLREGGNAIDAMITAVFLQHVNDYHMVSHFGSMSAIYYEAAAGKYYVLSAIAERPRADRSKHGDPTKVAIGGVVRGLEALAKRFGTRSWDSYLEPAIASAEEGIMITSFMYGYNFHLMEEGALSKNKECREFYMPDGFLVPAGQRWKMTKLAEHLKMVASEGADYMYSGTWGKKFVKEANKLGYRVSMEDMADFKVKWQEPVRFTYRGHSLVGSPPPDTGGLVVGYNLNILENFELKNIGHYTESAEAFEIIARAFVRVAAETGGTIKDPLNFKVPSDLWLSKEYGRIGAQFVNNTMIQPGVTLSPADEELDSAGIPVNSHFVKSFERIPARLGSNHNVIVDQQGNWISLLHTIHGGAPEIFIDGIRAWGSGASAYTQGPGRRMVLPITAIMIENEGKPWLAMGTPGSPPQPVSEVLLNMLEYGMSPMEAIDAPRFWASRDGQGWQVNPFISLRIESRIQKDVRKELAAHGLKIEDLGTYNWHTGSMQIIWRDAKTGKLNGVTDARRLGHTAGF